MDITGLGSVADLATSVINRIWPNKNDPGYIAASAQLIAAQQAGQLKELDDQFQQNIEQIKANAAQPGMNFRDGAGWVCVVAFALSALKSPIEWGCALAGHPITLPSVDTSTTVPMLLGLLGLGGLHMYQTVKTS